MSQLKSRGCSVFCCHPTETLELAASSCPVCFSAVHFDLNGGFQLGLPSCHSCSRGKQLHGQWQQQLLKLPGCVRPAERPTSSQAPFTSCSVGTSPQASPAAAARPARAPLQGSLQLAGRHFQRDWPGLMLLAGVRRGHAPLSRDECCWLGAWC